MSNNMEKFIIKLKLQKCQIRKGIEKVYLSGIIKSSKSQFRRGRQWKYLISAILWAKDYLFHLVLLYIIKRLMISNEKMIFGKASQINSLFKHKFI